MAQSQARRIAYKKSAETQVSPAVRLREIIRGIRAGAIAWTVIKREPIYSAGCAARYNILWDNEQNTDEILYLDVLARKALMRQLVSAAARSVCVQPIAAKKQAFTKITLVNDVSSSPFQILEFVGPRDLVRAFVKELEGFGVERVDLQTEQQ